MRWRLPTLTEHPISAWSNQYKIKRYKWFSFQFSNHWWKLLGICSLILYFYPFWYGVLAHQYSCKFLSIFTILFICFLLLFSDYEGIIKVGIIGGILLRESISVCKIPPPTDDKSQFQIPIGIPISMPESTEMSEDIPSSKNK